jgi:hypothetical protein
MTEDLDNLINMTEKYLQEDKRTIEQERLKFVLFLADHFDLDIRELKVGQASALYLKVEAWVRNAVEDYFADFKPTLPPEASDIEETL